MLHYKATRVRDLVNMMVVIVCFVLHEQELITENPCHSHQIVSP